MLWIDAAYYEPAEVLLLNAACDAPFIVQNLIQLIGEPCITGRINTSPVVASNLRSCYSKKNDVRIRISYSFFSATHLSLR